MDVVSRRMERGLIPRIWRAPGGEALTFALRRSSRVATASTLAVALVALLAACSSSSGSSPPSLAQEGADVVVPLYRTEGSSMLATVEGTLEVRGGCLIVNESGAVIVPVWPQGTALHGAVVKFNGRVIGTVGRPVELTGGSLPIEQVMPRLIVPIPASCRLAEVFVVGS